MASNRRRFADENIKEEYQDGYRRRKGEAFLNPPVTYMVTTSIMEAKGEHIKILSMIYARQGKLFCLLGNLDGGVVIALFIPLLLLSWDVFLSVLLGDDLLDCGVTVGQGYGPLVVGLLKSLLFSLTGILNFFGVCDLVSSGPLTRLLGPMNFELGIVNNAFSSFSSDVSLLALRDFWDAFFCHLTIPSWSSLRHRAAMSHNICAADNVPAECSTVEEQAKNSWKQLEVAIQPFYL
ncbi:hypothetical protein Tco_1424671 [Tanacetum coccineum]